MNLNYAPVEMCRVPERYPIFIKRFQERIEKTEIISRHWHTNIELTYRMKYRGKLFIENRMYSLEDDSLHIINSREIHEIHKYPQEELHAILVSIPFEFIKELFPDVDRYYFQAGAHTEEMKKTILKMTEVLDEKSAYYYIRINGLALELIYLMLEDAVPAFGSMPVGRCFPNIDLRHEISRYLQEHILEIHSTADLSAALGYSREHLSRSVKKYYGTTCKELIDITRIHYAIHMMKVSSCTLQELSEMSGFPSYRNFVTLFQRYYKMHPRDYRSREIAS